MARRISGGAAGGIGAAGVQFTATTLTTADNADITVDPSGTGIFKIASDAQVNDAGVFRFADADSSNWVGFKSAATVASNVTWTLPAVDGSSGQFLSTNASGTLSWQNGGVTVTDQTSSSSTHYLYLGTVTTGTATGVNVSTTKLTFQPSTGTLTSTIFSGSASNIATTLTTTNATFYPTFVSSNSTTTNQAPNVATAFTFNASTGTLTSTIVTASSDERLKENVRPITGALDLVQQLAGVIFNRIGQTDDEIGYLAQQVEKILPQVVHTAADGMKSIAYGNIVALLSEAIKEQQAQIEELKGRLA
jgi:hypothetical protein